MDKTKKVLAGVSAAALVATLTGCNSGMPSDSRCNDWDYDKKDKVWECDDYNSHHYGHYYYGGSYYKNRDSLHSSSSYKSYKSSGFGSGSRSHSFGG
ncbi:aminotransferase yhxA [Priestia aryabhattai]